MMVPKNKNFAGWTIQPVLFPELGRNPGKTLRLPANPG
jgi:hypothetical protein